jgi:hypothetical protein
MYGHAVARLREAGCPQKLHVGLALLLEMVEFVLRVGVPVTFRWKRAFGFELRLRAGR